MLIHATPIAAGQKWRGGSLPARGEALHLDIVLGLAVVWNFLLKVIHGGWRHRLGMVRRALDVLELEWCQSPQKA